jgi:hypothetical protein
MTDRLVAIQAQLVLVVCIAVVAVAGQAKQVRQQFHAMEVMARQRPLLGHLLPMLVVAGLARAFLSLPHQALEQVGPVVVEQVPVGQQLLLQELQTPGVVEAGQVLLLLAQLLLVRVDREL